MHELAIDCDLWSRIEPIVVERSIDSAHPALPGHFPGDPIVPGAVLLDEIIDVISSEYPFTSDAGWSVRSAKFVRPVRPGDCLTIRLAPEHGNAERGNQVRFECSVRGDTAASGALAQRRQGRE
jgi:3-hydroxymyristoyl/3-hydroxydecanoyl-(acyl carrier protein) dehydratase